MRKYLLSIVIFCLPLALSAQTQQGYVKTKGRLGSNGTVIQGKRLSGAMITVKGRNSVLSGSNGSFTLTISNNNYYLQNVQKQGYVVTDPDILSRQYSYSKNPLVLVMEDEAQQEAERRAIERKIKNKLYADIQKRSEEIEALREQNKITEEKYHELQQKLNKDQDDNESIIQEMAERYSRIDFDALDEFNRRVCDCIINGRLTEADSLLRTKGDISNRIDKLNQHHNVNIQVRTELIKSEEMEKKEKEDIAQDCYNWFELYKLKHQNDSAAYYLGKRASLNNPELMWLLDAGSFVGHYLANQALELDYYIKAEKVAKDSSDYRKIYNNIGAYYYERGYYRDAVNYYEKSVSYYSTDETDCYLPRIYSNLSAAYRKCQNMDGALLYASKALTLSQSLLGEDNITTAECYNTIGLLSNKLHDYEKSLDYYKKAIAIAERLPGDNNWDIANYYVNIAGTYADQSDYTTAKEYYTKALELRKKVLGENHPLLGNVYNNLGYVERESGHPTEALYYYEKAVYYWQLNEGTRFSLIDGYGNIAVCYEDLEQYESALKMYEAGEVIVEELYQRGDADAMLFLPFIYRTLGKLADTSEEYRQRYIHFMDDKTIAGHVVKGMKSLAGQHGFSGWYYILEYCDWNIDSTSSFFTEMNEMRSKHQTMVIMQDDKIYYDSFDYTLDDDFHIYYVTQEEKAHIKELYVKWKKDNKM